MNSLSSETFRVLSGEGIFTLTGQGKLGRKTQKMGRLDELSERSEGSPVIYGTFPSSFSGSNR